MKLIVPMDITLLKPVVRNFGWKSLVLPRGHRQMVQAMVDTHAAGTRLQIEGAQEQTRAEVDLVRGKGKLFEMDKLSIDVDTQCGR